MIVGEKNWFGDDMDHTDILVATLSNEFKQRAHRNESTFGLNI